MVTHLMKLGAEVNFADYLGRNILHFAIKRADLAILKKVLKKATIQLFNTQTSVGTPSMAAQKYYFILFINFSGNYGE